MRKPLLISATILSLGVAACGTQNPAPYNTYGTSKGAGSVGIHTVLKGDTLYTIAKNYQLPMREIITLNHIEAPYVLNAGFRMKLPTPNEHQVREGDTLSSIAQMYELSVNRLANLNSLSSPFRITKGQILRLPTSMTGTSVAPAVHTNSAVVTPSAKPQIRMQKASATARASAPRAIPKSHTPKMSGSGRFMKPVEGRVISSYGPKADGLHNDGINIKAARGTPVRAAENGIVVYTGDDLEGYGNLVLVRHDKGMMSAYAHLDKSLIKRGEKIKRGQAIGTVGSTGQVDTPQLHFEIRKGTKPLDPARYL
ncbi:MAG: M23 family metallopeptidase [Alphaproteobacteria bacterium]|nr:M23 family metallopeptidase [Alphaproteobacteria bacterium]